MCLKANAETYCEYVVSQLKVFETAIVNTADDAEAFEAARAFIRTRTINWDLGREGFLENYPEGYPDNVRFLCCPNCHEREFKTPYEVACPGCAVSNCFAALLLCPSYFANLFARSRPLCAWSKELMMKAKTKAEILEAIKEMKIIYMATVLRGGGEVEV